MDRDPDHHQNLIICFFYHPELLHKISLQSVHNVVNNAANRQTDVAEKMISLSEIISRQLPGTMRWSEATAYEKSMM